jgi:pimeloyl-ACP methyl ester carboxylesterase
VTVADKRREARSEWAFRADENAILDALAQGRHVAALREYFGPETYAELSRLAPLARGARPRPGPRVLIVPGIMGSRLGGRIAGGRASRMLWIDPLSIAAGGIGDLVLPGKRILKPQGVLLYAYAKLRLEMQRAGFDVELHAYDWRLGLDRSGLQLAERIRALDRPVILVGHSMGGLVARMAMGLLPKSSVRRLIMVGTPNYGSYAPVQAFRGTYPFVRKMTILDPEHSPEHFAATVFKTFPGLYQLLPPRRRLRGADLYEPGGWPDTGPTPDMALLAQAAGVRAGLAPPDSRMRQIIGVDRRTIVAVRRKAAGFDYELRVAGDGTVPVALARLPRVPGYFVAEWHANLANNPEVIRAVVELARRGRTTALPQRWRARRSAPQYMDDEALRTGDGPKIDWRALGPAHRAALLRSLTE